MIEGQRPRDIKDVPACRGDAVQVVPRGQTLRAGAVAAGTGATSCGPARRVFLLGASTACTASACFFERSLQPRGEGVNFVG